ncbi:MAG: 2Fe-2S iron-sulfur cluster-binding protein [Verrucomicrobiota bacterium JB022]|nr:2Fe-2S iron-sulfur cluster-binding protein [Verrucomicrobiota bacterium JB022]
MSEQPSNLITINLNGKDVQVEPGLNIIEATNRFGVEVPHYCYHPHLSVPGNCRMCLVEMGMPGKDRATGEPMLNPDGTPQIMWVPKPVIGCATKIAPGMHIKTESDSVKECREGVMEFLLINHPLDCPICDQAGECRLQEFATDYGRGYSRFVERKNVKPKRTRIGPRVMLDDERCILCSRCVRFCNEVIGKPILGFTERGSYSTLTTFPGKELDDNYSLNTVDICPVGALTSTDFRFKMRVWFLKETDSIDTESSVGCNTVVGSREGKIHRITPRRNDQVNDTWMPDTGRMLYKQVEAEDRLTTYSIAGKPCTGEEAVKAAAELLLQGQGKVAIVGSGRLSLEEQFLLKKIASVLNDAPTYLVARYGEPDGKLISADRNPNVRGALLTGLISELPEEQLATLRGKLENGEVTHLLVVGEDLTAAGIPAELVKQAQVAYIGTQHCDTCQHSKIELPLLTAFEKSGTFVNQQFRVQKFHQAVAGPVGTLFGLSTFTKLYAALTGESPYAPSPAAIWSHLAAEVPELAGLRYQDIPGTGKVLDASRFAQVPFREGKSLHYTPAAEAANA